MKKIPLTQNQFALVDNEDFERINSVKWYAARMRNGFYAMRSRPKTGDRLMHREILKCPKGMVVDHINHNTLDNRKKNLRICTPQNNQHHQNVGKANRSGYKGVYLHSRGTRYVAQIKLNRKMLYLGTFDTAIEGARAYNTAAKLHHKQFAVLNKI